MGQEISKERFTAADHARFRARVEEQLPVLAAVLARPGFGRGPMSAGVEVELALVDPDGRPAHRNEEVAELLLADQVSLELDRFSAEYDTPPVPLDGRPFSRLADDLRRGLGRIDAAAGQVGARPVLVGTLPTLRADDLVAPDVLTSSPRYMALARGLEGIKTDDRIAIDGVAESLDVTLPGVAAEGANAALQVHLRVPPDRFAATLDAAHLVSAPAVAVAANSPFFLGRDLWDETRIPLFEQAVSGLAAARAGDSRAFLAHGWTDDGIAGVFREDVAVFPPLLPELADEDPGDPPALAELRLHAGSVWRWNRPVYDPSGGGHVRIELRALPTGPTVTDMAANAAFLVGATLALAERPRPAGMPFAAVRANLGAAARHGLGARLAWPEGDDAVATRTAAEVVAGLLPSAEEALVAAGVAAEEAAAHLEVIAERLRTGATGAVWQRRAVAALEPAAGREAALRAMTLAMAAYGHDGPPVARWGIPAA